MVHYYLHINVELQSTQAVQLYRKILEWKLFLFLKISFYNKAKLNKKLTSLIKMNPNIKQKHRTKFSSRSSTFFSKT